MGRKMIGFGQEAGVNSAEKRQHSLLNQVAVDDILEFGMIPELVGRLPVISPLQPLELDDLVHILTDPKNSLVKQYKKFFEMESAELEFMPEALTEIARIAKTKNTGARGLRSVVDELLFDVMYALPDEEQGRKYVVTPEIVRGVAKLFPRDDSAAA
jgi:ATP-dependent Clp protease ATP-binding subunit ClpX